MVAHAERHLGSACARCGAGLIGHDAVVSLMLGFGDEPLCLACLAAHHGREPRAFLEGAWRNVGRLACYRAGWRHADARLAASGPWPEERIPSRFRVGEDGEDDDLEPGVEDAGGGAPAMEAALAAAAGLDQWDAGDRGCGELALELKLRVGRLEPGARLLLRTTDRGAPADLPAWCRLTGNTLVAAAPPRFLIEAKPRPTQTP